TNAMASAAMTTAAASGAPAGGEKRNAPWRNTCGRYSKRNWNSDSNTASLDGFYMRKTTVWGVRLTRRWSQSRHRSGQSDPPRRIDFPERPDGGADGRRDADHG